MITIGYSTRTHNPQLQEYFKRSCGNHIKGVEIIEKVNPDGKSLTEVYNDILSESKNNIVVLCHDDIYFEKNGWGSKLIEHFKKTNFGILGVAGTTNIPESGRWWEDQSKMVGIVNHEHQGKKWESRYCKNWNEKILKTVMVDGLFIVINKEKIKHNFNTDVEGFHFYDVEFCTQNYLEGVDIGVIFDIRVTHKSIGQTNDEWEVNRMLYSVRNKSNLPIIYVPDIPTDSEKENFKFGVIVQSSNFDKTKSVLDNIKKINDNANIIIISNSHNFEELQSLENVKLINGFYDDLQKNLDIIKYEENLLDGFELVFITNDNVEIINDVFSNSFKTYKKNKNNFGCQFPTSYNTNKSIFSTSLILTTTGDNQYGFHLLNNGSQYNIFSNNTTNPFGNLVNFICTTPSNIKLNDWFKSDYETSLIFNDFSTKLSKHNKNIFIDNSSFVIDRTYENLNLIETIRPDFQIFLQEIQKNKKIHQHIKIVK
jgi:hypothetical protein